MDDMNMPHDDAMPTEDGASRDVTEETQAHSSGIPSAGNKPGDGMMMGHNNDDDMDEDEQEKDEDEEVM